MRVGVQEWLDFVHVYGNWQSRLALVLLICFVLHSLPAGIFGAPTMNWVDAPLSTCHGLMELNANPISM